MAQKDEPIVFRSADEAAAWVSFYSAFVGANHFSGQFATAADTGLRAYRERSAKLNDPNKRDT